MSQTGAEIHAADRRIPSLDGLRAVSVLYVIAAHIVFGSALSTELEWLRTFFGSGWLGVDIFFEISGFLITGLLISEASRTGKIDLIAFIYRRAFRILPPLLFYLAVVAFLNSAHLVHVPTGDFIASLRFYANFRVETMAWPLIHSWSLSIEEQFYLAWPFILRNLANLGAFRVALAIWIASPAIRMTLYWLHPQTRGLIGASTYTHLDMIMLGCILALAWSDLRFQRIADWTIKTKIPVLCVLFLFFGSNAINQRLGQVYFFGLGMTVESIMIGILLVWTVKQPGSAFGRLLNSRLFVFLGGMSYSIYLWQQVFVGPISMRLPLALPISVPLIFACAYVSRRLIEIPALSLRRRLESLRALRLASSH